MLRKPGWGVKSHGIRKVTSKSYLIKGNLDEAVGLLEGCIPSNWTEYKNQKSVTENHLLEHSCKRVSWHTLNCHHKQRKERAEEIHQADPCDQLFSACVTCIFEL